VPIYVTKEGRWLTGEALGRLDKFSRPELLERECRPLILRPMTSDPIMVETGGWRSSLRPLKIDVVLPLLHGPNGEDGTLQGLLEMLGLAYAGSGVLASALCMNKIAMKRSFESAGIPQVPYIGTGRSMWDSDEASVLATVSALCDGPVFVKPARGGSSIGITRVETGAELVSAIELALRFDDEVVVEAALADALEVNCAVLESGGHVTTSALEAVHADGGFLSYDQKYLQWSKGTPAKGTGKHEVPAVLPEATAERVRELAKTAFEVCGCEGVARVDFLVHGDDVFVNEINTLPGSLAFYLWEAVGMPFGELLDSLLVSAIAKAKRQSSLTFCLDRNLLADIEARKGTKTG